MERTDAELRKRIAELEAMAATAPSYERYASIRDEIARLKRKLDRDG